MLHDSGGADKATELGAVNRIGDEEHPAGVAGGECFGTHDALDANCVNTVPGAQNLEDRCRGIADGIAASGGASTRLPPPATSFGDPTAVAQAIKSTLPRDEAIDGVVAVSAGDANSAAIAIQRAGATGRVSLGPFDMDEAGLDRIKAGGQLFAIDQQPWLRGFLAVTLADGHANHGLASATQPILAGPGVVDAANVDVTVAVSGHR